jgi:hypothetical protein
MFHAVVQSDAYRAVVLDQDSLDSSSVMDFSPQTDVAPLDSSGEG